MLKPIDTRYDGHLFRSRLEARWAVFFNHAGIRWEYEKEGYDLPSGWYLPDFWLPDLKCWFEVKPEDAEFDRRWCELVCESGFNLYIAAGVIPSKETMEDLRGFDVHSAMEDGDGFQCGWDEGHMFCECPHCGTVGIEYMGWSDRIKCCSAEKWHKCCTNATSRFLMAYDAARMARFERGGQQ